MQFRNIMYMVCNFDQIIMIFLFIRVSLSSPSFQPELNSTASEIHFAVIMAAIAIGGWLVFSRATVSSTCNSICVHVWEWGTCMCIEELFALRTGWMFAFESSAIDNLWKEQILAALDSHVQLGDNCD